METETEKRSSKRGIGPILLVVILVVLAAAGYVGYKKGILSFGGKSVATVNGYSIKEHDLEIRLAQVKANYQGQNVKFDDPAVLQNIKTQLVNEMVNEQLVYEEAVKKGNKATDEEMKAASDQIKANYGGDDKFKAQLESFGMTEKDLNVAIERNIVIQKYIQQFSVEQNATASDDEISQLYAQLTQGNTSTTTPKLVDVKDQLSNQIKQQKVSQKLAARIEELKQSAKIDIKI